MNILITGINSYIGKSIKAWFALRPDEFCITSISVRNNDWELLDFSQYDALIHVASIVHNNGTTKDEYEYNQVVKDLTVRIAQKAKREGISHFLFMSTMAVYGLDGSMSKHHIISSDSPYIPKTLYGKSKLNAENELKMLASDEFRVSFIRAPMVFGPNCPGNYRELRSLVQKLSVMPEIHNCRSMIFIFNLTEFIRRLLLSNKSGIFFPQNSEFFDICKIADVIARQNNKKLRISKFLGASVRILGLLNISKLNKAFGSLYYDKSLSDHFDWEYCVFSNEQSLDMTEMYWDMKDMNEVLTVARQLKPEIK
jgi:nucleoside-diphosphate-sugar epimerase